MYNKNKYLKKKLKGKSQEEVAAIVAEMAMEAQMKEIREKVLREYRERCELVGELLDQKLLSK